MLHTLMIVTAMNALTGLKLLPIFEVTDVEILAFLLLHLMLKLMLILLQIFEGTDVEILAFLILHLMLMTTWVMKNMCHHDTEIGISRLWNQDKDQSEQSEEGVRQIQQSEQSEEGVR